MPQLVKGGKHTYGWTQVGELGQILLPPEAVEEYGFKHSMKLLILPGSKKSGGFSVASQASFSRTPLAAVLQTHPDLGNFQLPEGAIVDYQGRLFSWVEMRDSVIQVPAETLQRYGVYIGDRLLVIRGSDLGPAFAVRGLIIEEAKKHQGLAVFEADS
jgi:bifunctional DNA-binding transcriptional regulator/antitoxin component of YhaV-PrlF toxin-antitoxin module